MNLETILIKIKDYILRTVDEKDVNDDTDLFETGIIHSLFAIQLVIFIEKTFHLELEEDLTKENMQSIRAIANLIGEKSQEE